MSATEPYAGPGPALHPGASPNADDVVAFAREHSVELVDLKFTDLPGTWQHFAVAARELERGGCSPRASASTAPRSAASRRSTSRTCCWCPTRPPRCIDPFHE